MKVKVRAQFITPVTVQELRNQLLALPADAEVSFYGGFGQEGITVIWEEER